MRGCFFRDEFLSASSKEESIAIKEKIRSCVEDSNKQSQGNGGTLLIVNRLKYYLLGCTTCWDVLLLIWFLLF